jgi:D-3-phosphoglycerate dehydrogenase
MSNPLVYVLDPYHKDAIDLAKRSKHHSNPSRQPQVHDWHKHATAIMIRSETRTTKAELSKAQKLSLVVKQGVGVDNVDLDSAKKLGIKVFNTPALNSEPVAELSLTLAICLGRRVCEMQRRLLRGETIV